MPSDIGSEFSIYFDSVTISHEERNYEKHPKI